MIVERVRVLSFDDRCDLLLESRVIDSCPIQHSVGVLADMFDNHVAALRWWLAREDEA